MHPVSEDIRDAAAYILDATKDKTRETLGLPDS
jgi:hypothetical protein